MIAYYAAIVTLVASVTIIALALVVSATRSPALAAHAAASTIYGIRSVYFVIILAVWVIVLTVTLPITPYARKVSEIKPDITVKAVGEMWRWTLTPGPDSASSASASDNLVLPVGKTVAFEVSAEDVNHNFAIYNAAGELIAQVQAMPGYTNRLLYTFNTPGHYYVLCLEYCGVAHHLMNSEFDVK